MNRLPIAKRATIINLLVEGSSLRSISRVTGASINTVTKLLVDAGEACVAFHNETVRTVNAERAQVDEIWQFCYAKAKNVETAKAAPEGAGDTWTWTAIHADSKLIVSWLLGERDGQAAYDFMMDLAERLASRVQLTSDGLRLYEGAGEDAFGADVDVDYAQLIKVFGDPREKSARYSPATCKGTFKRTVQGDPDPDYINTSYVRAPQPDDADEHAPIYAAHQRILEEAAETTPPRLALYFVHYNFCRVHKTLRMSPAMASGLTDTLRDAEWIVGLIDARTPQPRKPGTKYQPCKSN